MIREDYIIRIVKQIVDAIARLAGLRQKGDFQAALRQAESAYDLLGVPPELAAAVSAETLAGMLGHPDKIRLMARLSQEEGDVHRASGDPLTAMARYRRAFELVLEARGRAPSDEDAGVLQELARHFPAGSLDPKYRPGE
jgi:hypothetical protein